MKGSGYFESKIVQANIPRYDYKIFYLNSSTRSSFSQYSVVVFNVIA